jgi:hypothetical protein
LASHIEHKTNLTRTVLVCCCELRQLALRKLGRYPLQHQIARKRIHPANSPPNGRTMRNDRLAGALVDEKLVPEYLFVGFDECRLAQAGGFFAIYHRLGGKGFRVLRWGRRRGSGQIVWDDKLHHYKNGWLLD